YLEQGSVPEGLAGEVTTHLLQLEQKMGKKLGDHEDPLLVSVRSGAKFSMPGMMETVLNIGLSDESVHGLAKLADNERFAWDAYRRLIQMFGKTVLDIDGEAFEPAIDAAKTAKGTKNDLDLDADDLRGLVDTFKGIVLDKSGRDFPQEPREQMDMAVAAVFNSWNADRAILYRRQERIPTDLGTAVNIVAMVFGNLGMDSGTGVAFTRDPGSGQPGVYGDYLQNAQGEDVVAGVRNTVPLQDLEQIDPKSYPELMQIMNTLENHYKDLCDIEFTIERGKLWMLQTRVGKRTAGPAFRLASQAGGSAGSGRRGCHPGPARDQPRRPARHDRRARHPDQQGRQDQSRCGGCPRDGQDLRVRRRPAGNGPGRAQVHRTGRRHGQRGRPDLHRRHVRRGVPRRGAGRRFAGRRVLRGRPGPVGRRARCRGARARHPRRRAAPPRRARERRHRPGLCPGAAVRRQRRRADPDRAHVPR